MLNGDGPKELQVFAAVAGTPRQFVLEAVNEEGNVHAETFTISGRRTTHLARAAAASQTEATDENGNTVYILTLEGAIEYIIVALREPDRQRFRDYVNDEAWEIDSEAIYAIRNWINEELSGRPTLGSTTSSGGRPETSGPSMAPFVVGESTSSPSPSLDS